MVYLSGISLLCLRGLRYSAAQRTDTPPWVTVSQAVSYPEGFTD